METPRRSHCFLSQTRNYVLPGVQPVPTEPQSHRATKYFMHRERLIAARLASRIGLDQTSNLFRRKEPLNDIIYLPLGNAKDYRLRRL
jgi:hypothetical protein